MIRFYDRTPRQIELTVIQDKKIELETKNVQCRE